MLRERLIGVTAAVEAAIDYPEEDIPPLEHRRLVSELRDVSAAVAHLRDSYRGGRIVREGFRIAICGRPNAGKSSLFNLLVRQQRALVTPTPGTTRDYLSEWIDLGGFAVNVIDTAGLRARGGSIERAGQKSTRRLIGQVDLVLWLIDVSSKDWEKYRRSDMRRLGDADYILIYNKIDVVVARFSEKPKTADSGVCGPLAISCKTRRGLKELLAALERRIRDRAPDLTSGAVVTSARHWQKLGAAQRGLRSARRGLARGDSPEVVAFDLRSALNELDEITGKVYTEDILDRIFSEFCIGK